MNCRIVELKVEALRSGNVALYVRNEDEERRPVMRVLSLAEIEFLNVPERGFTPYFDDLTHLLQFRHNALRVIDLSGNRREEHWYELPLKEWLNILNEAAEHASREEEWERVYTPQELLELAVKYSPSVRWEYAEGFSDYLDVRDQIAKDLDDERSTGLKRCLDGLKRIGLNYSHGEPSTINLSYDILPRDGGPASYYFNIVDSEGRSIMRGGIVAHTQYEDGEPTERWKYSTHT
jgi:hypothetical protein